MEDSLLEIVNAHGETGALDLEVEAFNGLHRIVLDSDRNKAVLAFVLDDANLLKLIQCLGFHAAECDLLKRRQNTGRNGRKLVQIYEISIKENEE